MNRFGQQQRYDGGSTERGDDTNRQEHGARHETGESVGWIRYPLPSLSPEPNREKTLSVRKHPISETDHIISLISHDAARVPDLHEDVRDALRGTPVPGLHVPKGGPHGAARRVV